MVSIAKVVGALSCGFLLCVGLSQVAQAGNAVPTTDEMKADQSDRLAYDQIGQLSFRLSSAPH